ncbi:hypothetical protein V6N11_083657 [Hibiscus sabdariffa]|uniref:Uncharacterized protein n=1 Tax=Hibiscus sabdariffa TaxID=183260 RepID=A0ABR2QCN0_9ROSI
MCLYRNESYIEEHAGDSEVDGTESERGGFMGHPNFKVKWKSENGLPQMITYVRMRLVFPSVAELKQLAGIAQLGERQTEDLKVACSIHAHRNRIFSPFPAISRLG